MATEKVRTEQEQRQFEVAAEILNQLGGRRFLAMTGANSFVYGTTEKGNVYIIFRYPGSRKSNSCSIELTADDLYKVKFGKVTPAMTNSKIIAELDGVYNDQLQELFTEYTGLYTHL